MQITENLNLVIPLLRDEAGSILVYGYHTPISREVYEANFRILAATKAELFAKGLSYARDVGPQIASLMLKDEASREAISRGDIDADGNANILSAKALLAELKRLTMVIAPTPMGWEQIPVEVALARKIIDQDDWREAEAGLVFFTCLFSMCAKAARRKMIDGLAPILGGLVTLSPLTEYLDSLPKLKTSETTQNAQA